MPSIWKWKVFLFLALVLLSAYLLVPTFFGFKAKLVESEETGKPLQWYYRAFQAKGINLGLDLRGGIYLEFEVELGKAIENKVDTVISDIERILKNEKYEGVKVSQDIDTHTIIITANNADEAMSVGEMIKSRFSDVLSPQSGVAEPNQKKFGLNDRYQSYLEGLISRQALEKVRNRIDRYGVAEPSIQRIGENRISVELPGMKDPDRAIGIIKKAGKLEFKIVEESMGAAELAKMVADAREAENLPDDYSIKTVDAINKYLREKLPPDTEIAFETQFDPVAKKITGAVPYLLERRADVTGEMLKNASVQVQNNEPYVSLIFDATGTQKFGEVTTKNVGKRMAILLDGTVNKAPVIKEPIKGGQAQITLGYGNYADLLKEAEDLTLVLQEGALPAQLTEATKTIVGPSLGADSIRKGIIAAFIGAMCVIIFMIGYYRLSGVLADLALFFNLLFILAGLALFQATLTLPGIAGIALTFGMAVDANVLIFERIREELKSGKTAKAAVSAGYSNAMRAIIDSNLTTLIAGVVLYQFGTGPIRGFAVTLIMGLLISMYTAIVCTRMVYDYLLIKRKIIRISV
jgi:protein-export membrane protein SecD